LLLSLSGEVKFNMLESMKEAIDTDHYWMTGIVLLQLLEDVDLVHKYMSTC
jgi:hypothetical protein